VVEEKKKAFLFSAWTMKLKQLSCDDGSNDFYFFSKLRKTMQEKYVIEWKVTV
jgi:hypothetical protein